MEADIISTVGDPEERKRERKERFYRKDRLEVRMKVSMKVSIKISMKVLWGVSEAQVQKESGDRDTGSKTGLFVVFVEASLGSELDLQSILQGSRTAPLDHTLPSRRGIELLDLGIKHPQVTVPCMAEESVPPGGWFGWADRLANWG